MEKQVTTLESATRKLVKAHKPGDTASHMAAFQLHAAAQKIHGNLPDQDSKASKLLGRTYPNQVRRLGWIIDETQLILDEVRVENTRREAQNVYLEAGRTETRGQGGALTKLSVRSAFDKDVAPPASNPRLLAHLGQHGYATYEEAFDDAEAQLNANPRSDAVSQLRGLQPERFGHEEKTRRRAAGRALGLSAAELAAVQTFTAAGLSVYQPGHG